MPLTDLIISKVRVKLLTIFFLVPDDIFYVRQLVRKTDEEINAVRRELAYLEKKGILSKEPRGNRLYYALRKNYHLYYDLLGLVNKTAGLGGDILKNRKKLGQVKFVVLSGKYIRKLTRKKAGLDLLVIGKIDADLLASIVGVHEKKDKREINFSIMDEKEFIFRKERKDPFLSTVFSESRMVIIGDEEELVS